MLSQKPWGRELLLKHAEAFTLGIFSDAGPTEDNLRKVSFKTIFIGKGWSHATPSSSPATTFDKQVRTSVSGPEPGYIATAQMFSAMARHVIEDRPLFGVTGGVFTPAGLVASGGADAIHQLVKRLRAVGIKLEVEEEKALTPKPIRPTGDDEAKRPAWQTALNGCALFGWLGVFVLLMMQWNTPVAALDSPVAQLALTLECVCTFEVFQIAIGAARGNIILGVSLHYTRWLEGLVIMPIVASSLGAKLILLAWSLTEVGRYPAYLAPSSKLVKIMRYVLPVITFPIGAGAEAWAAFASLDALADRSLLLRFAVAFVVPFNVLGGTFWAYPAILKKAALALKGKA